MFLDPHSTIHVSNIGVRLRRGTKLGTPSLSQANYICVRDLANETTTPRFPRRIVTTLVPVA